MKHSFFKNIRSIIGLSCIPLFASLLFSIRGESYFFPNSPNLLLYSFSMAVVPWLFPLFSALTGIYSAHVFKSHSVSTYVKTHVVSLFVPFLFGTIVFAPIQAYFGAVTNNGYQGSFIQHYAKFFTSFTDMSGIDGSFTAGHLWLLFFLFISALLALLPARLFVSKTKEYKIPLAVIMLLGLLFILIPSHSPARFSFLENLLAYLLGFFVLSLTTVQEQLKITRHWLSASWIMFAVLNCFLETTGLGSFFVHHLTYCALTWIGILGAITVCYRYFDKPSRFSEYFSKSFFALFFFSQTAVLFCGYFMLPRIRQPLIAFAAVCCSAFVLSLAAYELCRRLSVTRLFTGIQSELYNEDI